MNVRTAASIALALFAFLFTATSQAQLFRTYLASTGNDANPCTLQLPCRLLPAALSAVASGGEIWMLDSANYNTATVTINKSVSILAIPGVVGSVVAASVGFNIAADGLTVRLRNLSIGPLPGVSAFAGIDLSGASDVIVENTVIGDTGSYAISLSGPGTLRIVGCTLRDVTFAAVNVSDGGLVTIHGSKILGNGSGVNVFLNTAVTAKVTISDSLFSGGSHGVVSQVAIAGAVSRVSVTGSVIERMTAYGLFARTEGAGTATLSVSRTMVANGGTAVGQFNTAVVYSLGDNHQHGNTSAGAAPTALAPF